MPTFRLRNIRLRAVARRQRGSGPSRAEETCKPLHPDKIKSSSTANAPPTQKVSPSRGAIVRVVIPPGAKEGSKIGVCPGVVLRVPERSAWFISRPGEKTEKRYFRVRFDATIIYPKVVKEVARENEQPSREVRLDTAEDSTEDENSVESIYTARVRSYMRRAVDQFGLEAACIK